MRRAQNADTHALKLPRLSQNSSPVCFSFVLVIKSDMYLESESEKRWFTHSKKYHTLPHLFLATIGRFLTLEWFSTTEWPVLWMCVPFLQRYGPFKNGPSVEGSRGGAPLFKDKHEVRATLSSVNLNTVTSFSHTKQLNIFCPWKYQKVCQGRKHWFITILCFTYPLKSAHFSSP